MKKLLLIDGNSLLNRAFYAFGGGGTFLSFNGAPTNATYGFLNMFIKGLEDIRPTHVVIAFDVKAKTFRHEMYDGYKATRKPMPDDLRVQLTDLKKILTIMGVKIIEKEGSEADDVIGTLAKKCGAKTIILTADKDAFQLIDERVELHLTKTGVTNLDVWTVDRVTSEYEIKPQQFIDLKALMGDTSDNIPGAKGIGEKTALKLIQEHSNIENLYASLDKIQGTVGEKLTSSQEMVLLSKKLATIDTNVDVPCDTDSFSFNLPFNDDTYSAFSERGFKSIIKRTHLFQNVLTRESVAQNANTETSIIEISTTKELNDMLTKHATEKQCAITYDSIAFYVAFKPDAEYKIKIIQNMLDPGLYTPDILVALKPLLESDMQKYVFDSKQFTTYLTKNGISLTNVVTDAHLIDYLLSTRTNVTDTTTLYSHYGITTEAKAAPLLAIDFEAKLTSKGLLELYRDIELPLVEVLLEMEKNGMTLNMAALDDVAKELDTEIKQVSEQIFEKAGERFNINSTKILGEILYKKLGLDIVKKTKTGLSTDEEALQKLSGKHPIVPLVLRYRKLYKLLSTYVIGYKNLADPQGMVHSTFHNTATVTGRLSSSEPNLQNIPKRGDESARIRCLFRSRFNDGHLVCADYSQIELRILAHLSKDESMGEAFRLNRDIHTETACKVFDKETKDVTSDMRRIAKAVNFGIIYGMGSFGLGKSLGIPQSEAATFIEKYFAQFPKIKEYLDSCRDYASSNGYAKTIFGRRRYIPELASSNGNIVQFGARAAMNMPMQGSASDIVKKAMVHIHKRFKEERVEAILVAQIHDELIFDTPKDEIATVENILREEMCKVATLSVPLVIDIDTRKTL